jgi:hypothetical protein
LLLDGSEEAPPLKTDLSSASGQFDLVCEKGHECVPIPIR